MKADGSISVWGDSNNGGSGSPTETGFTKIFSNDTTFVALHSNGYVKVWGGGANHEYGATGEPVTSDILTVIPSKYSFTAIKKDGSVCTWGDDSSDTYLGAVDAPSDLKFVTSNFSNKKSVCELHRWSAIDEINQVKHELNEDTYYFDNDKFNPANGYDWANSHLFINKIGLLLSNYKTDETYSFQKLSIKDGLTSININSALRSTYKQTANSNKNYLYYFDILDYNTPSISSNKLYGIRFIREKDGKKYMSEYSNILATSYTSNFIDVSGNDAVYYNASAGYFQNSQVPTGAKSFTFLISENNKDWIWWKNDNTNFSWRNGATGSLMQFGTSHPKNTMGIFTIQEGNRYYFKVGFSKANNALRDFNFINKTFEVNYYSSSNAPILKNETISLTKGNEFITMDLENKVTASKFANLKDFQIKYWSSDETNSNGVTSFSNPIDKFTIPKSTKEYTFYNLKNNSNYYFRISGIDYNNYNYEDTTTTISKDKYLSIKPQASWNKTVLDSNQSEYNFGSGDKLYCYTHIDDQYIGYICRDSNNQNTIVKMLKNNGTSYDLITDLFATGESPKEQLENHVISKTFLGFYKNDNFYVYLMGTSSNRALAFYKQRANGTMQFINKNTSILNNLNMINWTDSRILSNAIYIVKEDEDNAWLHVCYKVGSDSKTQRMKFWSNGSANAGNLEQIIVKKTENTNYTHPGTGYTDLGSQTLFLQDPTGNMTLLRRSYVYFKKAGDTSFTSLDSNKTGGTISPDYISFHNNFVHFGANGTDWGGWINFNKNPSGTTNKTTSIATAGTAGWNFTNNTSHSVIQDRNGPILANSTHVFSGDISSLANKIRYHNIQTNNTFQNELGPNLSGAGNIITQGGGVHNTKMIFFGFSNDGNKIPYLIKSDSPPASPEDQAVSSGISSSDVQVLEAVTFENDANDSTKKKPSVDARNKIKAIMQAIKNNGSLSAEEKVKQKRKQRRASLKVLFNKSRQTKKMVIPKEELDLPAAFTKTNALVVKAGETMKLSDLAEDEGVYAVLDDGEEIIYETTNTILTFKREDVGDSEEYGLSASTWTDADGEDIVINVDDITGTFKKIDKDGTLLPGDVFTIDGQKFFIGSVGTGGSSGSGGDPYIYPLKSNIPVKLPNKKAFYRLFEQGNNFINIEVERATTEHKNRMFQYAKNITPVTHNIVMDGYFYSKLFISAEGRKLTVDYTTKKASCDEKDLSFFKFSQNIKRFNCGEFYEDCKSINIKWRTKENKLIKTEVLFFPNPHIENGINVVPETLKNTTGMLIENYKPKLMQVPTLTTEKFNKLHKRLAKSKKIHQMMSIKGKNEKWVFN